MSTQKVANEKVTPRVIILRGCPGTGKSTISQKVMSLLKRTSKKAYIPIDNIQHFDLRNASRDKFKLGIFHAALLCRSFIAENFDVVIDYVASAITMKTPLKLKTMSLML